ncbi:DUF4190 domain-containing protein [Candidatus Woesearchaeota archaeon]|nr:DUF4190 domain-containing protein [Candidatus Woesearchaeota archaeon]
MAEKKEVAYILGIVSLAMAFLQPFGAIIIGIIGLVYNNKEKSKTAKSLNILGIVFGIIFLIIQAIMTFYVASQTFPVY